tara:strand:+ start:1241 stop:2287 length:1047 start_codon:yes stop_codon:yes gene_type:complete
VSKQKIQIKKLYKIFGNDAENVMELVNDGISKQELLENHGHVLGLRNINIDVPEKCIRVIMGLSGSGKSTLIRHINRLIEPTSGQVLVGGEDVLAMSDEELKNFRRSKASMVFQKFALLPHRTVIENVGYGLQIQKIPETEINKRSQHWIDRVGLTGFEDHYPAQLSGGMQQRVGLARALATDAEILLMDEAFSALDPLIRTDMQGILLGLQEELHKTIVFITHDLDEALRIGDEISILRDGEVVQQGTSQEIVMNPSDDYIADFIKDVNRARVLEVRSIMEPSKTDKGPRLDLTTPLEDAMGKLSASGETSGCVVDDNGHVIGKIELSAAISAIKRPGKTSKELRYR